VDELCVRYGAVTAVRDVSFEVAGGTLVTIVGANGAGKSSLVNSVCGTVPNVGGQVWAFGEEIGGRTPEAIARSGIALVPEGRRIFGALSVAENLRLGILHRRDRSAAAEDIAGVLDRFPALRASLKRSADSLSGGQAQQLAIARSLVSRPRLLILDEPSLGLAPVVVNEIFELLENLRDDGMTILLIEQNVTHAIRIADRSLVLSAGRVVLAADREDLPPADEIAAAILGVS
jgi:branched-chain amino acid transport system ATP-binding protein